MTLPPLAALLEEQFSWRLAFPLTNVTAFPSRRQRADHTQRSPLCAGTLDSFWGLIDRLFLFFFSPVILVFVWNNVLSPCLLSGDEAILHSSHKKGQRTRRMYLMYLTHPSIHPFSVEGAIACTVTGWKITIRVTSESTATHDLLPNPCAGSKRRRDAGVKFSRKGLRGNHIWRKSVKNRKMCSFIAVMTVLKEVRAWRTGPSFIITSQGNIPQKQKILTDNFDLWAAILTLKKIHRETSCVLSRISLFLCIRVTRINTRGCLPALARLVDSLLTHLHSLVAILYATLPEAQYRNSFIFFKVTLSILWVDDNRTTEMSWRTRECALTKQKSPCAQVLKRPLSSWKLEQSISLFF